MALGQLIASGSFTSDGSAKDIVLRSDFDFMVVNNYTQQATTQNPGRGIEFKWQRGFADDAGLMISKENAANTVTHEVITSGGFTRRDTSVQAPEAAKTGTAITAANPAVATLNSHGYSVGDRLRLYSTTGMLQVAGMEFTVTAVGGANNFTLGYLDASGFAAAATAITARRIPNNPSYVPAVNWITKITQAAQAVVTLSVTHNLAVNDQVRLIVPSAFGMIQADQQTAKVVAVSTANNTVTLDIDSSAFTAFAFPASASVPFTHAQLVPYGDVANGVDQALDNQAEIVMRLAAGVDSPAGSTSDVIYWQAFKAAVVNQE